MIHHGYLLYLFTFVLSLCQVQSEGFDLLRDISTLTPPCSLGELVEKLPKNSNVVVYFSDRYPDGTYNFGYILSSGERRYERATLIGGFLDVEGFYSERKFINSEYIYETTRYVAEGNGYYPSSVEVTFEPPKIPAVNVHQKETEAKTEKMANL